VFRACAARIFRASEVCAATQRQHIPLNPEPSHGVRPCLTAWGPESQAPPGPAADAGAVVFSDELNHASIIDGARLAARAGAGVRVYRHNDLAHLERLLVACPPGRRRLVITDSLFSMDGARPAAPQRAGCTAPARCLAARRACRSAGTQAHIPLSVSSSFQSTAST